MASSPTWSGGRIFLCRVSFHADLFWYPFHAHATAVSCKRSQCNHPAQKVHVAGYSQMHMRPTYVAFYKWHEMVHGCMVYTEYAKMAAVLHGTSHGTTKQRCKYTTLVDIQNVL